MHLRHRERRAEAVRANAGGDARRLDAAGVGVRGVDVSEPTLDDVFLTITGRTAATTAN